MKDRATSFDIAHIAGVSQSTVSRALRNSPLVNQETRDRVMAIARELNYKVDKNASNLRQKQSRTLALLLFEDPTTDDSMINPFFLSMLGSITHATAKEGYDLLVSFQQLSDDWHADYEDTNKADGIILLGYGDYEDYRDTLEKLIEQETHFVRWGAVDNQPGLTIGCDNQQGGFDATNHLIEHGRKRFAFIGGASSHCPEFLSRFLGHKQALAQAGLLPDIPLQIDAVSTEDSGYQALERLLQLSQDVDAIFCASDSIALGVLKALQDRGVSVPKDVAVVGFDNIPVASFCTPPLTTVRQNTRLAGELLVQNLLRQIRGDNVENTLMPVELVVRNSCGVAH